MATKTTSIAIVGGGKGGMLLLRSLHRLSTTRIVGLCDVNMDAPGMVLARELGVFATTDLRALIDRQDLDVVIEATGAEKVRDLIKQHIRPQSIFIDSRAARLMMDLTEAVEEMQAKEAAALALREQSKKLAETAQKMHATVKSFASSFEQIASQSKQIVQQQAALSAAAMGVRKALKESEQIVDFIRDVAQETRILGLNASIEAVRAGDKGRGFEVVATNVRGLAANSAANADKVSDALKEIDLAVTKVISGIQEASATIASQQEITTAATGWNSDLKVAAETLAHMATSMTTAH